MRYQAALCPDQGADTALSIHGFERGASKPRCSRICPNCAYLGRRKIRMGDPVAGLDAELLGRCRRSPPARRAPGRRTAPALRQRLACSRQSQNAAIGPDEDHVERDIGVLHPERPAVRCWKSNSMPCPSGSSVRNIRPFAAFGVVVGHLDREDVDAGLADDFERLLIGRPAPAGAEQQPESATRHEQQERRRSWRLPRCEVASIATAK